MPLLGLPKTIEPLRAFESDQFKDVRVSTIQDVRPPCRYHFFAGVEHAQDRRVIAWADANCGGQRELFDSREQRELFDSREQRELWNSGFSWR